MCSGISEQELLSDTGVELLWYVDINVVVAQGMIGEKSRMFEIELLTCSFY